MAAPVYSPFVLLYCPCADKDEAKRIGGELLQRRLVACVNIVSGVESMYEWNETLQVEQECLLLAKTREVREQEIINVITRMHSYDTPAVAFFDIKDGHPPFLSWVQQMTSRL